MSNQWVDSFGKISRLPQLIDYSKRSYLIVDIAAELEQVSKDALQETEVEVSDTPFSSLELDSRYSEAWMYSSEN